MGDCTKKRRQWSAGRGFSGDGGRECARPSPPPDQPSRHQKRRCLIRHNPRVSSSRCRHPSVARNPTAPPIPAEEPWELSPDCARQLGCGRQTMIGQRSDHARRRVAHRFRPNRRNQSSPPRTAGNPLSDHCCKVGSAHRIGMRTSMRQWQTRFLWQNPADGRLTSILPGARY